MSRFVSAGGSDAESRPLADNAAWVKAQQQVEALRKPKPKETTQEGGKSLYEVLEANKAAKQDAFEEAARLKNQFRALDDDEVDFLDSVLEQSRAKEAEVKQDTAEQLEVFRKQRVAAEQALIEAEAPAANVSADSWTTKKKKRRRETDTTEGSDAKSKKLSVSDDNKFVTKVSKTIPQKTSPSSPKPEGISVKHAPTRGLPKQQATGLGLGSYSSDEDD